MIGVFLLFCICIGLLSQKFRKLSPIAPLLCMIAGLFFTLSEQAVSVIFSLILIFLTFIHSTRLNLKVIGKYHQLSLRLIVIALPITFILIFYIAKLFFQQDAFLLAALLIPIDLKVASLIISRRFIPQRIVATLNIEAAICSLIAVILLTPLNWGILTGAAIGLIFGWLTKCALRSGFAHPVLSKLLLLFLPFGIYFITGSLVGVLVAGLIVGNTARAACTKLISFGRNELRIFSWIVFGILGIWLKDHFRFDATVMLFGVLALFVFRFVGVLISQIGSKLKFKTSLYMSAFSPKGIFTITLASYHPVVLSVVAMSIVLHSLLSLFVPKWYQSALAATDEEELLAVPALPTEV